MSRPAAAGKAGGAAEGAGVRLLAPAKINLYLHLLGRRADGLHRLDSLVAFAGIGDLVEVRPAGRLTLAAAGPFAAALPPPEENLALRAARWLAARAGLPQAGAAIRLRKTLPVAAGIGGGSSDAAAVLRALLRLWRLPLAPEDLARASAALGADLPVCLAAAPRFVGGAGERLAPAPPLPPAHLVLVNPGQPLATAAVFAARRGPWSRRARWQAAPADAAALARRLARRRNDLAPAARRLLPAVAEALAALAAAEGCLLARLSGSGPTAFGLFAEEREAAQAAGAIAAARPGWWVRAAPLLAAPP